MKKILERLIEHLKPLLPKIRDLVIRYKPKTRKGWIIFGVVLLVVVILLVFAFRFLFMQKGDAKKDSELFQVRAKVAKKDRYTDTYTVMGTIKGAIENDLRFEIDGVLSSYNFPEGAKVLRGQVICSLDPTDSMKKVEYTESKFASERSIYYSASQRLKVYEDLFQMKAISEGKIQEARYETMSAKSKMQAAMSELELAQLSLAKTNLIALADGLLAQIIIKSGEYVTPQDVVAKFISGNTTNFEVDIPEKDVQRLKVDMKVLVNCDAYQNREFEGKLTEIAPTVKERTRTTTVKIEIPNDSGELRSGMFGRGSIIILELNDVYVVPADSVIALSAETTLVPIVKPDPLTKDEGVVELRTVTIAQKVEKSALVSDGINPGDLVIHETQGQLADGVRVKYTLIEEQAATPPAAP